MSGADGKTDSPGGILITGFDPFGGQSINPAWEAVKRLPDEIGGIPLHKACVPTVFGACAEALDKAVSGMDTVTKMILMVGQAGGRASVTPEAVALNIRSASIPDNAGNKPVYGTVIPGGENALLCPLPLVRIVEELKADGAPVAVSFHAGTFVCNDLYYSALNTYGKRGIPCCFIHVPFLPEQAGDKYPSLSLDIITETLEKLIRAFLKEI